MRRDDPQDWMWSEAIAMLTRAEQLHRQFFQPRSAPREAAWEPPVDVLELDDAVLVLMALPGVDANRVDVAIDDDGALVVTGRRVLPPMGAAGAAVPTVESECGSNQAATRPISPATPMTTIATP